MLTPGAALAAKHDRKPTPAVDIISDGIVMNRNKTPAVNAVVYLEDPATQSIKSYLTGQNGEFHFTQLSPQTDYEVWAEQNGLQSDQKFISKFSSKTEFRFKLKLEPHRHRFLGIF